MAEPYEVEIGGQVYEVDADTPQQAATLARLYAAREQGVSQAEAGAVERSQARTPTQSFLESLGRQGTFGRVPTPEETRAESEANIPELATAAASLPFVLPALAHPATLAKGLALSGLGAGVGGLAGKEVVGRGLEAAGLPAGTAKVTGTLGGLVGGFAGPMVGAKALLGLAESSGARPLALALRKLFPEAVESATTRGAAGVASKEATAAAEAAAKREASKAAEREAARKLRERSIAVAEERNRLLRLRLEGKAPVASKTPSAPTEPAVAASEPSVSSPVAVPASTGIPVPAASTETIVLKLQQQMKTPEGRRIVKELLSQMPEDQANQIRTLLLRGQAHPATTLGALFNPSAPGPVGPRPGEELARLLGQLP